MVKIHCWSPIPTPHGPANEYDTDFDLDFMVSTWFPSLPFTDKEAVQTLSGFTESWVREESTEKIENRNIIQCSSLPFTYKEAVKTLSGFTESWWGRKVQKNSMFYISESSANKRGQPPCDKVVDEVITLHW